MRDVRQANFTTKPHSNLHSLMCGYSFQITVLPWEFIYVKFHIFIF